MRISDWSSDVCSSDLAVSLWLAGAALAGLPGLRLDSLADAGYARTGCCGGANTVQSSGRGAVVARWVLGAGNRRDVDRKSTRLNSVTNAHLVCRLLLEKKKTRIT